MQVATQEISTKLFPEFSFSDILPYVTCQGTSPSTRKRGSGTLCIADSIFTPHVTSGAISSGCQPQVIPDYVTTTDRIHLLLRLQVLSVRVTSADTSTSSTPITYHLSTLFAAPRLLTGQNESAMRSVPDPLFLVEGLVPRRICNH